MVDLKPGLVGTDVRFFLDDGAGAWDPLQLPDRQPVTLGMDLSSRPDMTATVDTRGLSGLDRCILFGDGTGRPLGLFANNLAPGQRSTLQLPLHPGTMTRQRRRAAARAAAKGRTI